MNILQDHTKRVKKLCGIFVLVIIVHAEHVADLLKNLRTESKNNYLFYLYATNFLSSNLAFSFTISPTLSLPHSITSSKLSAVASVIAFSIQRIM